ncbi:MAG: glutamate--cysteine ligase [Micropruina sp.]|uniref:glutamate--cysteine ligase n=1 Tax=Micropruina sp. TaxID=2737536 RepID=UPI0039E607A7
MPVTFGVEEELLVVERRSGRPVPVGDTVVRRARRLLDGCADDLPGTAIEHEFKREQVEIGSLPCHTTAELTRQLRDLRRALATAAAESDAGVAAIATCPFKVRPTPTDDARYRRMASEFGQLSRQQLTCGQHVHVQVGSRDEGVGVIDRLPRWLPTLLALSANSPFWQGQDTDYASFRTIMWGLWPTAGPAGPFGDAAGYDAAVADMIRSGAALDDGMIYFEARLSARYPTVEIRTADVCTRLDDAVLIAALCRAMVSTAARAWTQGERPDALPPQWRRAASWRAARSGLTGGLLDPSSRTVVAARDAVNALVADVRDALEDTGDLELVTDGVDRLFRSGTGAERQRAALRGSGSLGAVVTDAVRRTDGLRCKLVAGPTRKPPT